MESEKTPGRGRNPAGWIVFFSVLLLGGVAMATWDVWRDSLPPGLVDSFVASSPEAPAANQAPAPDRITALREQVAALEDLIESQSRRLAEIEASPGARTIESLEQRLARLEESRSAASASPAVSAAAIESLSERIAALEKIAGEAAARGARDSAQVIVAGQLREALRESRPYGEELAAMQALAAGDARIESALVSLAGNAERGIPTLEALRSEFETVAFEAVRAADLADDSGLSASLRKWFSSLISVRRTGAELPGDSVEAVVARAEARLRSGDLQAAVTEVEALDGAAAAAAARWLAGARARLEAERSLRELTAYVIERLSAGAAPTETAGEGR